MPAELSGKLLPSSMLKLTGDLPVGAPVTPGRRLSLGRIHWESTLWSGCFGRRKPPRAVGASGPLLTATGKGSPLLRPVVKHTLLKNLNHCAFWQRRDVDRAQPQHHEAEQRRVSLQLTGSKATAGSASGADTRGDCAGWRSGPSI